MKKSDSRKIILRSGILFFSIIIAALLAVDVTGNGPMLSPSPPGVSLQPSPNFPDGISFFMLTIIGFFMALVIALLSVYYSLKGF